ncbi:MAG TPA: 2-succinyl-5-enolpyruvyl-6-hydroxy-3-cyclohexene-1-carboxylic-acid synthase [Nocardioides bacterium]|uniref:2-succinyl-5-enolpyruvyl-6-hydroxy-3- cyclohexene-1-carboxylic-acid synthase n=1 Tax=uncultured Nocardioides sp. TaxID=198441 RepID=UPI000EBF5AB0|nr:2-succinyl-5-enolpyruvyl-6-hydroxy-3-cyclohexene-1-carboxylic-acid synthase [uncultured Nocardioides sp.]HCB05044.1 2-succinyl-5-enolpyruvyl-6-hydroxy-3-cyclohexene-1-carboxylic-acid synthase [Nocardioides sp.]
MSATSLARSVITALVAGGVREVVVAPGSRNAPLAFAAYDAAEAGVLRLHTRIDERTAGFLALGLTKGGSRAAVICTSGTAVANLHPAVLEAHHARVPMVVVTADRPVRLRGTDANQTTDQVGVFGPLVPTLDVGTEPVEIGSGLVHLNVQLDDPLVPEDRWVPGLVEQETWEETGVRAAAEIALGPRTVVVAGDDAGPRARSLAAAAGWPLLAEPSSGARTGPALRTYRLLLATELAEQVERVVLFGHPTLSRPVQRLLSRPGVEVLDTHPEWRRPYPVTPMPGPIAVAGADNPAWLAAWQEADASVSRQLDALIDAAGFTAYHVAGAVSRALPVGGHLLVGASNPIRDLDLMATAYDVGSHHKVVANRGLSGIDGTVSTAIGAALARRPGNRNLALMGDVTFLHDAGGLVLGPDEPRPDNLTIVVANDDGGSIFSTLEQGAEEYAHAYERLFGTPHHVDLAALCQASRTPHWRVDSLAELEHALSVPNGGIEVVEAVVDRSRRRELDLAIRALRP